jgi:hypothetical protein
MGIISERYDELEWANFKFGVYEHYKGGRYTAIMIVQHHDTRRPMVVYTSHEKGSINCRPLRGWAGAIQGGPNAQLHDPDGWLDEIHSPGYSGPRFRYVGPSMS